MAPLAQSLGGDTQPRGHPGGVGSGDGGRRRLRTSRPSGFGRLNVVVKKISGKVLEASNILAKAFTIAKDLLVQAK